MDQLFAGSMEEMKKKLTEIELEMCEDCYSGTGQGRREELSENAFNYIVRIASYMSRNYLKERRTVLNLMTVLVRVAATGEYTFLQENDDLGFEDDVFEHLKGDKGFDQVLYALRLLKYYYLVFEKKHHPDSEWQKINGVYEKYRKMSSLDFYRKKVKKPDPDDIPEDEFIPRLREHLDRNVVGQDVLKKKLCTVVYQWRYYGEKTVLLMVGPSGSGKNYMIENLRSFPGLGRTVTCFDCSGLTPAGFNGGEVRDIFRKLKLDLARDRKKARENSRKNFEAQGPFGKHREDPFSHDDPDPAGSIIYLDEIDKIINFNHDSHGENVNAMVQQGLLSALAGTEVIEGVDTSKILFILGGSFPKIDEIEKRKTRCAVGFNAGSVCVHDYSISLRDQIMEIGGEVEFVGRIQDIVKIGKLSRDDLKAILMDEHIGEFKRKQDIYKKSGLQLSIDDDTVEAIVDLIENEPAGARSVKNIINQFADSQYFYDMKMGGYHEMKIHKGMLSGEPPIFTKGGVPDAKVIRHA